MKITIDVEWYYEEIEKLWSLATQDREIEFAYFYTSTETYKPVFPFFPYLEDEDSHFTDANEAKAWVEQQLAKGGE